MFSGVVREAAQNSVLSAISTLSFRMYRNGTAMIIGFKLFVLDNPNNLMISARYSCFWNVSLMIPSPATTFFQRFSEFPRWLRVVLFPQPFPCFSRLLFGGDVLRGMCPIEILPVRPSPPVCNHLLIDIAVSKPNDSDSTLDLPP